MSGETASRRSWWWIIGFAAIGVPGFFLRFSGADINPVLVALVFGLGIVGGAFLLSWAAEVAQLDVSAAFAIAVLALIALLPEYAIEAVLAWKAGASFDLVAREITPRMELVAANVTGANRLLIGLGWPAVILIFWAKRRALLDVRGRLSLEMTMLVVATLLTFLIFFMETVHVVLAAVLISVYVFYLWATSRQTAEEPELMGPSLLLGSLPPLWRRLSVLTLFIYSASVILVAAEPFVEALVETGQEFGISEFLLIQWVAPLASESPEIIVAILFGLRANPTAGLTILISAEVNQLTLLIGSMVVIFSMSVGELLSFPIDSRQAAEFLLTSAASVFAILLVAPRLISWRAGAVLLGLFVVHLFFTDTGERLIFSYIYLGMAAGLVIRDRRRVLQIFGVQ